MYESYWSKAKKTKNKIGYQYGFDNADDNGKYDDPDVKALKEYEEQSTKKEK